MRKTFFILLILSFSAHATVTEKTCTPEETHNLRLYKYRAAVESDRLGQALNAAVTDPNISWNEWRKLQVASAINSCARGKLGTLTWVCADGTGDKAAMTWPVISNKVYVSDYVFRETSPRYQAALFLHEATHHCGTNDARYFEHGERPGDGDYVGWQLIADTYSYWVTNGFCLPGRNC